MKRTFVVLVVLSGCLGLGEDAFTWTVEVTPFDTKRWAVDLPVPVGAANASELLQAFELEGRSVDVKLGRTADEQLFLRVEGRGPAKLTATADAPSDANVTWTPTRGGEPIGRVDAGNVRVVASWTLEDGGCRGEALGLAGEAGETTAMRRLDPPCGLTGPTRGARPRRGRTRPAARRRR